MRPHEGSGEDSHVSDRKHWGEHQRAWEDERLGPALDKAPERRHRFITQSGVEINRVYTPEDLQDPANDPDRDRPRYRFRKPDAEEPAGGCRRDRHSPRGLRGKSSR